MKSKKELERKAKQVAMNLAQENLEGNLSATMNDASVDWDPYLFRQTYEQEATLWRAFSQFEVILDSAGYVAGYVDHTQYEGATPAVLTNTEINHIVRPLTLIPSDVSLVKVTKENYPGNRQTYKALYKAAKPVRKRAYIEVEINPSTRRVIAIRPRLGKD